MEIKALNISVVNEQNLDQQVNPETDIVLFDGICNLCNWFVRFLTRRNRHPRFRFVTIQSEEGKRIMDQYNLPLPTEPESVILITGNKSFTKSDAILRIFKKMSGLYPILYGFIILPKIFRDAVYDLIARNRYRIFGKRDSCEIP